jgi:hypothetical protein
MPTLTIFRVLGKHLVGLYMAAGIAHFAGWFWPDGSLSRDTLARLHYSCGRVYAS